MNNYLLNLLDRNKLEEIWFEDEIPHKQNIIELFKEYKINVNTEYANKYPIEKTNFALEFRQSCNIKNVFIIVGVLKDFGLRYVLPGKSGGVYNYSRISLRYYDPKLGHHENFLIKKLMPELQKGLDEILLPKAITVKKFLTINPNLSFNEVLTNYYKCDTFESDCNRIKILCKNF